ncbi:Receptor-like proteiny region, transmembrane domain- and RING domain-containing protein 2 [Picochlorum sp. SENEW3]|nr:Receptor-like proteiny region, transmembrane domain- and RING domain-containing protein 2 [Picochlorum sp. SENEW3]
MSESVAERFWVGSPAVLLALCCLFSPVSGTILLRTGNYSFQPVQDVNAQFGPAVSPQGMSGNVFMVYPEDGCSPVRPVDKQRHMGTDGLPWIALIRRSHSSIHAADEPCTFDVKVSHAEAAGASAAIIYDDLYEGLLIMSKPLGNPDPGIPSVFIDKNSGYLFKTLLQAGSLVQVIITPVSDIVWISMFMSATAGFFAIALVIAAFCLVKFNTSHPFQDGEDDEFHDVYRRDGRVQPLSRRQLQSLQVVVYSIGNGDGVLDGDAEGVLESDDDNSHVCAICLEEYAAGEKLRVLPCQHRFHKGCVDAWLIEQSSCCPLCKREAVSDTGRHSMMARVFDSVHHAVSNASRSLRDRIHMLRATSRQRAQGDGDDAASREEPREAEMGRLIPTHSVQVVVDT